MPVRRSLPLGDHALEAEAADLAVKRLAVAIDVIGETESGVLGKDRPQDLLSLDQRKRTEVEPFDREEIEQKRRHRMLRRPARDVGRAPELRALLQALKARSSAAVEDHDLAVHRSE